MSKLRRRGWRTRLYLLLFALLAAVLLIGPLFSPYTPTQVDVDSVWRAPCSAHWLGTDSTGRDVLTRLLCGGRISLAIAAAVELIAFPIGAGLGYLGGILRNPLWEAVNRIMDVLFAFPTIILALFLMGLFDMGISAILFTIAVAEIPVFYIYVQRWVRQLEHEPFLENLAVIGVSRRNIFLHHILLHLLPLLVPRIIFNFATTIIFESTLSFIGIGIQPPTPSWGNMMSAGITYINTYPWLVLSTSVVFAITTLLLFGLGESLEELWGRRER